MHNLLYFCKFFIDVLGLILKLISALKLIIKHENNLIEVS